MINEHAIRDGRLAAAAGAADAVWVDLLAPGAEERHRVEQDYGLALPAPDEIGEIEATARTFEDDDGLHIHSFFLTEREGHPHNTTVAFVLSQGRLFSVRDQALADFERLQSLASRRPGLVDDAVSVLITLYEIELDALADRLEAIHAGLEVTARRVLGDGSVELERAIDDLARHENANGKVRLCLMDTQHAANFLLRRGHLDPDHAARLREVLRDIDSLLPHNAFLFERVNFLLQAAQGFINIHQNQIIKIFSVMAVVLLPPTLIASIYGMNFRFMPELHWPWGYPLALRLMIASAVLPYRLFRRRGWL